MKLKVLGGHSLKIDGENAWSIRASWVINEVKFNSYLDPSEEMRFDVSLKLLRTKRETYAVAYYDGGRSKHLLIDPTAGKGVSEFTSILKPDYGPDCHLFMKNLRGNFDIINVTDQEVVGSFDKKTQTYNLGEIKQASEKFLVASVGLSRILPGLYDD
ncbi:MAG: hypothetical protein QM496_17450 [Verrucomicrobiota bacterium]